MNYSIKACDDMRLVNNDRMMFIFERTTKYKQSLVVASTAGMLRHCEDKQIVNWQENADTNALCQHAIFQEALCCLLSLTQSLTQEDSELTRVYKTNLCGLSNRALNKSIKHFFCTTMNLQYHNKQNYIWSELWI